MEPAGERGSWLGYSVRELMQRAAKLIIAASTRWPDMDKRLDVFHECEVWDTKLNRRHPCDRKDSGDSSKSHSGETVKDKYPFIDPLLPNRFERIISAAQQLRKERRALDSMSYNERHAEQERGLKVQKAREADDAAKELAKLQAQFIASFVK